MELENGNPNPGNDPQPPLQKKRSPYRLMVDDAQVEDHNENSVIRLNPDKIAELGLFRGDAVSIKVIRLTALFICRESVVSLRLPLCWTLTATSDAC